MPFRRAAPSGVRRARLVVGLPGVLTLALVATALSAPAAQVVDVRAPTYYVDSTTGNDANPGTSSATP